MLKAAAVIGISSILGGVGLLIGPGEMPGPQAPHLRAYTVEVGITFDERVVLAALPEGLEPAPGFTGGIAAYGGEEGRALSPLSTGHIWIDVVDKVSGAPARYMLTGFASEGADSVSTIPLDVAILGETHELADGVLRILAWPDRVSTLELVVKLSTGHCTARSTAERRELLTSDLAGSLAIIHVPAALGWCEVDAEAGWVSVTAPFGHFLRPFVPQQVLWAQVAAPDGETIEELLSE